MQTCDWGMAEWMSLILFLGSPAVALQGAERDAGLVVYYDFDDKKQETIVTDKSGNKNDGAIQGNGEFVQVGKGYAFQFDGKTTCVECNPSKSLNIESAGTMMCWFNAESELQGGLVTRSTSGDWKDERCVISLRSPGGVLVWALADGKECQFRQYPDTKAGVWTHVVLTWDETSVVFYRDGQRIGAEAREVTPKVKDVPFVIGRSLGLGEPFFKGLIDEVRLYNRALSLEEVRDYYDSSKR